MSSLLAATDTYDDRREIWHLLHRLPPGDRVRFLRARCAIVKGVNGNRPVPRIARESVSAARRCGRADERLTNAVYFDLVALAAQWGADLTAAGVELERLARRCAG